MNFGLRPKLQTSHLLHCIWSAFTRTLSVIYTWLEGQQTCTIWENHNHTGWSKRTPNKAALICSFKACTISLVTKKYQVAHWKQWVTKRETNLNEVQMFCKFRWILVKKKLLEFIYKPLVSLVYTKQVSHSFFIDRTHRFLLGHSATLTLHPLYLITHG